jgi:hypothetical protein
MKFLVTLSSAGRIPRNLREKNIQRKKFKKYNLPIELYSMAYERKKESHQQREQRDKIIYQLC